MTKYLIKTLQETKAFEGLSKQYIVQLLHIIFDSIRQQLSENKKVELRGFGSFTVRKYQLEVHKVINTVHFKIAKSLTNKMNQ